MPAHRALLGETRARLAAAYVWSLSKGQARGAAGAQPGGR
jgi:cytochrome c oxidase cbb3-type subunit 3